MFKSNLPQIIVILARLGTWILIFTNLIPISLLVTLEMIKYVQAMFIQWDIKLYDMQTLTSAKVQTSTLNEELGQVKYIFSDKTGTLTKNYMEFRNMSIGTYCYGKEKGEITDLNLKDEYGSITNFNFHDEEFFSHLKDQTHINHENIHHFLLCLCLCNTVFTDDNNLIYQASSPDEMALINSARFFKYIFIRREVGNKVLLKINDQNIAFEVSHIIEYTSDRYFLLNIKKAYVSFGKR